LVGHGFRREENARAFRRFRFRRGFCRRKRRCMCVWRKSMIEWSIAMREQVR
jgi:hypothetical protein